MTGMNVPKYVPVVGSVDSQDSQSFRIAADLVPSMESKCPKERQLKLTLTGVLEMCSQKMRNLLLPKEKRSNVKSIPKAAEVALQESDIATFAASIVEIVSAEIQAKSTTALHRALEESHLRRVEKERQLATLQKHSRRHPVILKWRKERDDIRCSIKKASLTSFELNCQIHETRIDNDALRSKLGQAKSRAWQLSELKTKCETVSAENRMLNQTIQTLQGDLRVFFHLPKPSENAYLNVTNRAQLTFTGTKKRRVFDVDGILSGPLSTTNTLKLLKPFATSFLDGIPFSKAALQCFRNGRDAD